jgi:hypothetical protein
MVADQVIDKIVKYIKQMCLFLDIDEIKKRHSTMKNTLNSLQVGMTNPSPKSQIRRFPSHLPNVSFSDDEQRTVQSIGRLHNSPKLLPSPNPAMRRNHIIHTPSPSLKHNQTIQNILNAVSITPIQSSPTLHIREKGLSIVCLFFS